MIISQGAEAILEKNENRVVKKRTEKGYRIKELDERIRRERTNFEAKLLTKAKRAGVKAPKVFSVKKYEIEMEYIEGLLLRDNIENLDIEKISKKIGESIAKLHEQNIVHGDLTTSNMILKEDEIYFIDFGLGFDSIRVEDKAVDLRVLEEAVEAKHYKNAQKIFKNILNGYKSYPDSEKILKQLEKVRKRGRYL